MRRTPQGTAGARQGGRREKKKKKKKKKLDCESSA
jgi:hypothetical protein